MSNSFSVIIPARLNSSRLPSKLLAPIAGQPMLRHVVERALLSDATKVYVAVDHEQLAETVIGSDAVPIMTSIDHASGTDRVLEAVQEIGLSNNDSVVNVQGDEPLIPPKVINQAAQLLDDQQNCSVATLYEKISNSTEIFDPNIVKVVFNSYSQATYFSRAPIPWDRNAFIKGEPDQITPNWFRHVGIYAYKVWALREFKSWKPSRLETVEHLEQLRFLENGMSIVVAEATVPVPAGVDTHHDLERVRQEITTLSGSN